MKALLSLFALFTTTALAGPSSNREDWQAISFEVEIEAGEMWGGSPYVLPECADGLFLITHVSVAPDMNFNTHTIADLGRWVLSATTWQGVSGSGLMAGHALKVGGDGPVHAQVDLPAGQPAAWVYGWVNASQVAIYLVDGAAPVDTKFEVHISGSCGDPTFVAPLTASGRGDRQQAGR